MNNSKEILKFGGLLMLQHLLASFYGLCIDIFFNTFGGLEMLGSILSSFLYVCMIYIFTWNKGNKDAAKAHFGHMEESPLFGLMSGLFAAIPSVAFAIIFFLTFGAKTKMETFGNAISRFWFGAFIYYIKLLQKTPYIYALPILVVVLPLVAAGGYYLGAKDIRLVKKAVYKDDIKYDYPKKDNSAQNVLSEKNLKNLKK